MDKFIIIVFINMASDNWHEDKIIYVTLHMSKIMIENFVYSQNNI